MMAYSNPNTKTITPHKNNKPPWAKAKSERESQNKGNLFMPMDTRYHTVALCDLGLQVASKLQIGVNSRLFAPP